MLSEPQSSTVLACYMSTFLIIEIVFRERLTNPFEVKFYLKKKYTQIEWRFIYFFISILLSCI